MIAQVDDPYSVLSSSDHQELRMGTFVNANISGKVVNDIVTIPRDALRGANKIYLVDSENRLHIQEIKVLRNDVDYVYSYDKFSAGLRLVMTQMEAPVEGMALRIVGEPEEMPAAEDLDDIANAQGDDS